MHSRKLKKILAIKINDLQTYTNSRKFYIIFFSNRKIFCSKIIYHRFRIFFFCLRTKLINICQTHENSYSLGMYLIYKKNN